MALRNSEITAQIEALSQAFKNMSGQASENVKALLGDDYNNPNISISLEQINQNYQTVTNSHKDLMPTKIKYTHQEKKQLADIAVIQLQAIAKGFNEAKQTSNTNSSYQPRSAANTHASNTRGRSSTVHHVYHYNNRYNDNFWRDMMIWDMLCGNRGGTTINNNYYGNGQPTEPANSKKKDDGSEVTIAGIILACLLAGGALATLGYSAMQTLYRADEIVHAEDILANTAKLGMTALAAWQGYMLGAMLGAAYFANPLLGAICTAIIASAAGMALSKWAVELAHKATNNSSALDYDPRFCLSDSQTKYYDQQLELNSAVANEALRECAIAMKNESTNGLVFWQNPHAPLVDLMRNIKSGNVAEKIVINDKVFDLTLPMKHKPGYHQANAQQPVITHVEMLNQQPVMATAVPFSNAYVPQEKQDPTQNPTSVIEATAPPMNGAFS